MKKWIKLKVHFVDELGWPTICGNSHAYKLTTNPDKVTCKHCLKRIEEKQTERHHCHESGFYLSDSLRNYRGTSHRC